MSAVYRPSLAVHVVWHPDFATGAAYADALFAHLFEDPDDLTSHGLRIPVRHWRVASAADGTLSLPALPLDEAGRSVVVVFVEPNLIAAAGWPELLARVESALRSQDRLLPVSLWPGALGAGSPFAEHNAIRLHDVPEQARLQTLLNRVTHALCRLLDDEAPEAPVTVFLSHAKRDGTKIVKKVRRFLHEDAGIDEFYDAFDIREGDRWKEVLADAAARHLLLAVRTDAYATREWCQYEVLEAKLHDMPVVVLDALEHHEARAFPYLGNAPAVRWRPKPSRLDLERLLGVLLHQSLRARHFPLRVADLCVLHGAPAPDRVLAAPPELLTMLRDSGRTDAGALVYPDPPLGTDELALVKQMCPAVDLLTPTTLLAR